MMSRMKEDEKNEKIIRGLLKLPANRKCINCNNLGPQYVCTNFWTFICTTCSGLHREFCHRVKSISMSKFTTQEVKALQDGGNERARDIYFKEWDPHCNPLPDSSNTDRLRGFIKHVYVNRRYTGENNTDKPSQGKIDINDSNYSGRGDSFQGISISAPYNEQLRTGGRIFERNFKYVYGERSPGYNQGDNKRSSRRFEVVDDRVRDDRFGSGNQFSKFEDRRLSNVLTKSEGSSPSCPKDMSSPPVVRPVRDILGDNTLQLHVGDTPKSISTRVLDNSAQTQRTSSSGSLESSDGNPVQLKRVNLGSLIDFDADPEPPTSATPQQSVPRQPHSPLSDGGDWASFDNSGTQNATQATVSGGNLESALSPMSAHGSSPRADMPTLTISTVISSPKDGQQWPITQHQNSSFSADQSPLNPPYNAPVVESQPWGSSAVPSPQGPLPNPAGHLPPPQDLSTMVLSPTGRKELPADLFTAIYPSAPVSIPGWQMGPHLSIGYGMQYPMGMVHPQAMPSFPNTLKSTNPFDLGGEPTLAHAPTFPSMASLQGALPNVSEPSPLLRSSSFGNPSQQWILSQQYSSFRPALGQGQYMVQVPSNMHQLPQNNMVMMGHQGTGSPASVSSTYGNPGSVDSLSTGRYSLPTTPNSFSSATGNPFG